MTFCNVYQMPGQMRLVASHQIRTCLDQNDLGTKIILTKCPLNLLILHKMKLVIIYKCHLYKSNVYQMPGQIPILSNHKARPALTKMTRTTII